MNFEEHVEGLREAVTHAETLGLSTEAEWGMTTLGEVEERLGLSGSIYTLALVGGTGVGKSSLLNAMAGAVVSPATVLRPTTEDPLAWVSRGDLSEVEPLLGWLDVGRTVEHDVEALAGVAVIDMPDFDSIVTEHRETVDHLLPRLDSVLWVVDPQKYDDERLYEYLRPLAARSARVEIVLNKVDQLTTPECQEVTADLRRRAIAAGLGLPDIRLVSATSGEGVADLLSAIDARADAKQMVAEKLKEDMVTGITAIAVAADATGEMDTRPHREIERQKAKVTVAVLDVIDLDGLSRQVAAAHLHRSAFVAGSVLNRLLGIFRVLGGTRRRTADPVRFLRTWRQRGDLSRAANALRGLYVEVTSSASPALRAGILGDIDQASVKQSLATAVDAAVVEVSRDIEVRTPWSWRILAVAQFIALAGVVVALLWFLTLWMGPANLLVGTVDVPLLGPVPTPLALLVVSVVVSLLVGGLARLDASWRGRRAAATVEVALRQVIDREIEEHGFARLTEMDSARASLAAIYQKTSADR